MKSPLVLRLAVLLAAVSAAGFSARAQTPLYTANATTATIEPGVVRFLQVVNLTQGPGIYSISSLTVSFNFTSADPQQVLLVFYTGINTNPNVPDALAGATALTALQGDDTPPMAGNYAFTYYYNANNPLTLTATGAGALGVEFGLLDGAGNYSTTANGRFTASAPTVGTAAGFVWNDANSDGVFAGSEQTRFGMANANIRFAMTGTLVSPAAPTITSYTRSGTTAALTFDSYTGVNYQLQRATSLAAGDWTNLGSATAGSTGTPLTFTDNDGTDPRAFYRVVASLPGSASAAASGVTRHLPGLSRIFWRD